MPDRSGERAADVLRHIGATVSMIPEGDGSTADLRCNLGTTSFLVEVKSRATDRDFARKVHASPGEPFVASGNVVARSRTTNRVRDAMEQLRASRAEGSEFLFFYYIVENVLGRPGEAEAMDYSLLGKRTVLLFGEAGRGTPVVGELYAPSRSAFAKLVDLDGAFIQSGSNLWLTVNWAGARLEELRCSDLYRSMAAAGGLRDHTAQSSTRDVPLYVLPRLKSDEGDEHAWLVENTEWNEVLPFPIRGVEVDVGIDSGRLHSEDGDFAAQLDNED